MSINKSADSRHAVIFEEVHFAHVEDSIIRLGYFELGSQLWSPRWWIIAPFTIPFSL